MPGQKESPIESAEKRFLKGACKQQAQKEQQKLTPLTGKTDMPCRY